jgi:D-alanyl-D-alanine carboxypeptidase
MVVDAKTGRTLYARNEDEPAYPGLDHEGDDPSICSSSSWISAASALAHHSRSSAKAAAEPPTKLGVRPGTTIKVEDAIKAMVDAIGQ